MRQRNMVLGWCAPFPLVLVFFNIVLVLVVAPPSQAAVVVESLCRPLRGLWGWGRSFSTGLRPWLQTIALRARKTQNTENAKHGHFEHEKHYTWPRQVADLAASRRPSRQRLPAGKRAKAAMATVRGSCPPQLSDAPKPLRRRSGFCRRVRQASAPFPFVLVVRTIPFAETVPLSRLPRRTSSFVASPS